MSLYFIQMKAVLLLFSIITMGRYLDAVFNKVLLMDPGALCLDGSPGAYYIRRGSDPSKILLYFEGGGWCGQPDQESTLESCYQRSKGFLGSSNSYPQTRSSTGISSRNANKMFSQATQVILMYCDGAGHQGYRAQPVTYKNTKLFFRGENITKSQLEDLQRTEGLFSKAKTIMITGISAGGLATFLWSNYIREKAIAEHIYVFPDSGIFLDAPEFQSGIHSYLQSFKNLFKLSNAEISPPVPGCVKDHEHEPQRCMFAQVLYKYIKVPLFPIQSLYDSWSIPSILRINCLMYGISLKYCSQKQRDYLEQFQRNTTKVIKQIGEYSSKNGYWASSCLFHVAICKQIFNSDSWRIPMNSENSIEASLLSWMEQKNVSHQHIDQKPWPWNKLCAGDYDQSSIDNQISINKQDEAKIQKSQPSSKIQPEVKNQHQTKTQKIQSKTEPSAKPQSKSKSQIKNIQPQILTSWKPLLYLLLALVLVLILYFLRKHRLQRLQSHQIIKEIQKNEEKQQSDHQSIELPSQSEQEQRQQQ